MDGEWLKYLQVSKKIQLQEKKNTLCDAAHTATVCVCVGTLQSMQASCALAQDSWKTHEIKERFPAHWVRRGMFRAEHGWDWAPRDFSSWKSPPLLLPLPGKRSLRDAQSLTERCWIKNLKRHHKTYDLNMLPLIKGKKVKSVMALLIFRNYLTEKYIKKELKF